MRDAAMDFAVRVADLNAAYSDANACAAHLLCDRHPPGAIACTIVAPDLSCVDLTYEQLRIRSERLASAFAKLGIGAGDRVATLMKKSEAYIVSVMAIWRLGAVHVPLFTAFAPPAIGFRLAAADCRAVISDSEQVEKLADVSPGNCALIVAGRKAPSELCLEELLESGAEGFRAAARGGEAPLIQIYTSGTTGSPKGVQIPVRALASFQCYLEFGLDVRKEDTFWNAADPGWAYGLYYAVLAPLAAGIRTLLLASTFSAETTIAVLNFFGVTNFAAAPTIYRSLRAAGVQPRVRLRCASSAGEPLTPDVNTWAVGALGVEVRDHYGQTETGMLINNHQHPALRRPLKPSSMGQAMPGWKAVILETDRDEPASDGTLGRLAVDLPESPLAWFRGYVGDPTKSLERLAGGGRFYLTGDMARIDDDGYFHFSSRDDDVIIMAGYRIGPAEVESVILTHQAIAECAVVATPDPIRGELLEAVVVLRSGWDPSEALTAEIQARVKTGFAAHAYPRRVHYVSALPKTPSGKIQRFLVRQQLRAQNMP
jgi:acetyl-CoA synthetase